MRSKLIIGLFIFLISGCLFGCFSRGKITFTENQLKFINPYTNGDATIVFKTTDNNFDTITFYKVEGSYSSTSNFEQGFYDTKGYSVDYRLTAGSYHKYVNLDRIGYRDCLFHISKSSGSQSVDQEFCFLGLIFDNTFLEKIKDDTSSIILFDNRNAQYKWVNYNESIKSFKFQKDSGIISFVDKNNKEWKRSGQILSP